jgi:DHA1 family bicyclomycin/chloramphenicol resistance-like MFS transporter
MREFTILMAFLMSIVALSIDAMLPALGVIGGDLSVENPNHVQYLIGFIFIGMSIGQLVCGPFSDALGRKKVLYAGIALFLAGSAVSFFAQDLGQMLAGRFIQGLGVAGPYVSAVSIVRDKYAGRDMARIMSLIMMIFIAVPAIAPSIGQGILLFASWHYIFALYIVYAIVIGVWIHFRLEESLPPERRIPFKFRNIIDGFYEVVSNRIAVCYMLCMGITFGSFLGYLNSSQQIFQVQFGVGQMFTVYFGGLALVLGLASFFNSRIVEKYGMSYICIRSMVCIILASATFMAINFMVQPELWMFLAYAAILFFCFGLLMGNINSLAMEPMGHVAGIASAVIGSVSSAISMLLGSFIGQLYDNTLVPMTAGFLGLGIVGLLIMLFAEGTRKRA